VVTSVLPKAVTAITDPNIKIIPADCWIEGFVQEPFLDLSIYIILEMKNKILQLIFQ
jgi:hypothetical protein